jgi:hypothetical protein
MPHHAQPTQPLLLSYLSPHALFDFIHKVSKSHDQTTKLSMGPTQINDHALKKQFNYGLHNLNLCYISFQSWRVVGF